MSTDRTSRRLWGYGLVVLALLGVLAAGPRAWATPAQSRPGQGGTVPTPTPVVVWSPTTVRPTQPPAATATPTPRVNPPATASPATATPTPAGAPPTQTPTIPSPTAAAESGASLALVKEVARLEAWPGATVEYTVTLTNTGSASAREIVVEDTLPQGLDPGAIQGTAATWDSRTLRARAPLLPPGGRLVVHYTAVVQPGVPSGGLLVNQARATAAAGLSASAAAVVALPPAELPAVGGALGDGHPAR